MHLLLITDKVVKSHLASLESRAYVNHVQVLKICPACQFSGPERWKFSGYGTITISRLASSNRKILLEHSFPKKDSKLMRMVQRVSDHFKTLMALTFQHTADSCEKRESFKLFFQSAKTTPSAPEKVAVGHSQVFRYIMENFTINVARPNSECTTSDESNFLTFVKYITSLFTFPYYSRDTLPDLGFPGCGKQAMNDLAFSELTIVYYGVVQTIIWLFLALSTVAVSITLKIFTKQPAHNIFLIGKVFVDQGNPIPGFIARTNNTRCMTGLFLLMGIILSNAYENSNVYNMAAPRRPILYKYFEELVRDKLHIFTRHGYSFGAQKKGAPPKWTEYEPSIKYTARNTSQACFRVYNYSVTCTTKVNEIEAYQQVRLHKYGGKQNLTQVNKGLVEVSKLHPEMKLFFASFLTKRIGERKILSWRVGSFQLLGHLEILYPEMLELETMIFLKTIGKCHKSALIMQSHL